MKKFLAVLLVTAASAFADESVLVMAKVYPAASADTAEMSYVARGQNLTLQVDKTPAITVADVAGAKSTLTEEGHLVEVVFTPEGAEKFKKLTAESVGKQIAIVVEGKVVSAPVIQTEIGGGKAIINGYFSPTQADELAAKLNKK